VRHHSFFLRSATGVSLIHSVILRMKFLSFRHRFLKILLILVSLLLIDGFSSFFVIWIFINIFSVLRLVRFSFFFRHLLFYLILVICLLNHLIFLFLIGFVNGIASWLCFLFNLRLGVFHWIGICWSLICSLFTCTRLNIFFFKRHFFKFFIFFNLLLLILLEFVLRDVLLFDQFIIVQALGRVALFVLVLSQFILVLFVDSLNEICAFRSWLSLELILAVFVLFRQIFESR